MKNALTIDLEDYYHVSAFNDSVAQASWSSQQSRVAQNTDLLLNSLDEAGCKATFFTLGWVAEHNPEVVKEVAKRGHEIACHSLRHRTVYEMSPEEFRDDSLRAKELLEDLSGKPVRGYRAPSFSINHKSLWALTILAELGFSYDSSIFPVNHPSYGMPHASRAPFRVETPAGPIVEFPMTTLEFAGRRSPFCGGAYFRLLPYWYTRWGIRFLNNQENRSVCVYLHPWELDPNQPRMSASLTSRLRHYIGLRNTPAKFQKLIHDFEFCPLGALADCVEVPTEAASLVHAADLTLLHSPAAGRDNA
jgi:polysaccharide deacetylase family protein (PEP-CTERM system associated)